MVTAMSSRADLCSQHGCDFVRVGDLENVGIALSTLGHFPVNGLRHPATKGTTRWYIWCGKTFSEAADFFTPLCVAHALQELPDIDRFLGLPPGYRFLTHGEYVDVWFDGNLLNSNP
jgi:hypothetical protein